jgi:hypothetical protein
MRLRAVRIVSTCAALASLASVAPQCDPVEENAVDALGGEAPGVRRGPLHRPGQPCLLCHDGAIGDPPAFSVAGTVFDDPVDLDGANGATVVLTDSTGNTQSATTNAAGNFYLTPSDWSPTFPLTNVGVVSAQGSVVTMQSEIGRSGACATCHVAPAGPSSPGPVCLALEDGGVPP